jgi:hypothetical protein
MNPNDLPAGAILCSWTGSRSCAAGGPKMPKPAFGQAITSHDKPKKLSIKIEGETRVYHFSWHFCELIN